MRGFEKAAAERLKQALGTDRPAAALCEDDWTTFIGLRSSGVLTGRRVGPRAVARDLRFLVTALRWATKRRPNGGEPLLLSNPLQGLTLPPQENARRPVLREVEYHALLEAADAVDPAVRVLLVLAHETGHRIGAIRQLRWSDVDVETGSVLWRAEHDKLRHEHVTPLTEAAREALAAHRQRTPGIGEAFVFPAPGTPSKPLSRHLVRDWWGRTVAHAGLPRVKRRGWHSVRRKFASELMGLPLKVLSQLGGWRDTETIVKCYQHANQDQLREALATRENASSGG